MTKTQEPDLNGSRPHYHAQTTTPGTLTRITEGSQLPAWISATRTAKTALSSPDLLGLRIWWSYDVTRAYMHRLGTCLATMHQYTLSRAEELMLMSSGDVIIPRQHAMHVLGHVNDMS